MSTPSSIREFVVSVPGDGLFTTADVLHCGSRRQVDQALYLMVKSGEIVRWANGVFSLPGARRPSFERVAQLKANARGNLFAVASDHRVQNTFATSGSTSSFEFGSSRIYFKHVRISRTRLVDVTPSAEKKNNGVKQQTELEDLIESC